MSTPARSDPVNNPSNASKAKKGNNNNKKKKNSVRPQTNGSGGVPAQSDANGASTRTEGFPDNTSDGEDAAGDDEPREREAVEASPSDLNGLLRREDLPGSQSQDAQSATDERFDALVRERDHLRTEVTELRKSLEEIQSKHEEDLSAVKDQLEETRTEKDHAETQHRNLLGKINTIKSQLGERLKADAEELSRARTRIEELEEEQGALVKETEARSAEIARLGEEAEQRSKELSSLRNRTNLSQQNWLKEKEELVEKEAYAREEFEVAKQAMHDWEVLAMEERSHRENLAERVADLEEQVENYKEAFERAAAERDSHSVTVDGLQKALQDIQSERRKELRELVETSQTQLEELRKQHQDAERRATDAQTSLESARKELELALPFEKEVKEKNLLIGKLRHEAVILSEHLTKALKILKKGKTEDNVDRHIVTSYFLHFLELDRSDPKKFQVLQLIAALLSWTDEQREKAGLVRAGTSTSSSLGNNNTNNNMTLRLPSSSPFQRTPSAPSLHAEYVVSSSPDNNNNNNNTSPSAAAVTGGGNKESLAELWSNFLEQEAQVGAGAGAGTGPGGGGGGGGVAPPKKKSGGGGGGGRTTSVSSSTQKSEEQ